MSTFVKCPRCGGYCTPDLSSTALEYTCICGWSSRNIKYYTTDKAPISLTAPKLSAEEVKKRINLLLAENNMYIVGVYQEYDDDAFFGDGMVTQLTSVWDIKEEK